MAKAPPIDDSKSHASDDRIVRLAKRLGIPVPESKSTVRFVLRADAVESLLVLAQIGMELAKKEPEFSSGRGRRKGSKSRQLAPASKEAMRQRRRRKRKEIEALLNRLGWGNEIERLLAHLNLDEA